MPVLRSATIAPDLSRSGCNPIRIGGVADVERHRQDPRLDVAVSRNIGQRNAPVLADVDAS